MDRAEVQVPRQRLWLRRLLRKIVVFAIVAAVFGWFYGWASPWAFPKNKTSGFGLGMLHGGLMPLALPSLVLGRDVNIFAADNTGRLYKIGYICGINLCGLAFFGALFSRPKRKTTGQKNQLRYISMTSRPPPAQ
jgi:predicted permease